MISQDRTEGFGCFTTFIRVETLLYMHKEQEHIEEAERKEGEKGLYEMALNPSLELSLLTEEDQLLTMLGMHPQERVTLLYPMDKKLQFSILSGLPSCTCTRKKHCAGDIAYTLVAMNKKPKHFRDIFQMFELKVQLKILLCIPPEKRKHLILEHLTETSRVELFLNMTIEDRLATLNAIPGIDPKPYHKNSNLNGM